jgi:precorrin-2 dehydrogenase/sirohydrochlorin ferrochelatase
MTKYLPINLNVNRKKCLVVGGGKVAERKVKNLLICGAKVVVVSPELSPALKRKRIRWVKARYAKKYLAGTYLVIAATNDHKLNRRIAKDCRKNRIIMNVVDSAKDSDFISPAVLRKQGLVVAVSTDGKKAVRSKRVRDELKSYRFRS